METVNMMAEELGVSEIHIIYKSERESNSNKGFNISFTCLGFHAKSHIRITHK